MALYGKKYAKYRSIKTEIDGVKFDSKAEARRYASLKLLQAAGEISDLELQPIFPIKLNGEPICKYVGDFRYKNKNGDIVVEDLKAIRTPVFNLKRKMFEAAYGLKLTIIDVKR